MRLALGLLQPFPRALEDVVAHQAGRSTTYELAGAGPDEARYGPTGRALALFGGAQGLIGRFSAGPLELRKTSLPSANSGSGGPDRSVFGRPPTSDEEPFTTSQEIPPSANRPALRALRGTGEGSADVDVRADRPAPEAAPKR